MMHEGNDRIVPNDVYKTTLDWIVDHVAEQEMIKQYYKVIYPRHTIVHDPPKGMTPLRWDPACVFNEAFVAVIPGGRVLSTGYVITPNNRRILDVEFTLDYNLNALPPAKHTTETVAVLSWGMHIPNQNAFTQNNYAHWLFDILPRLHLYEKSGIPKIGRAHV